MHLSAPDRIRAADLAEPRLGLPGQRWPGTPMNEPLRVLILEDNPSDTQLLVQELQRAGFEPHWQHADTPRIIAHPCNPTWT